LNIYFKPAQLNDVRDAFRFKYGENASPHEHYEITMQALSEIRDAFKGGRRALRFLNKKPGESADQWDARNRLFQNVPLIKHIINSRSSLAYGHPPTREYKVKDETPVPDAYGNKTFPLSQAVDEWFGDIYEYSGQANLFRKMVIPAAFRDGQATVKLIVTEDEEQPYRMCYMPRQNVCYVMDPTDASACLGVIEILKLGREFRCTLWTLDSVQEVDDQWRRVGVNGDNPVPSTIPFVPFSPYAMTEDFGNPLDDAVLDQKHLINVRSQMALGYRAGMFPQLFTTGVLKGPTYTGADGKERIIMSPESMIEGEQGASAQYLTTNIAIKDYNDVEQSWFKTTLEAYGTSSMRVDSSHAPEQPMAMLLRMQPSLDLREEDIQAFECSEDNLARVLMAYAIADGEIQYNADELDFCVEFPGSVIPMDQQREREQDLAATVGGLMLREDYVSKWVMEDDATAEDIAEYIAKLDAEQAKLANAKAAVASSLISSRSGTGVANALISRLDQGKTATGQATYQPPTEYSGNGRVGGGLTNAPAASGGVPGSGGGGGRPGPIDGGGA
jgi:hypothetical protein